MRWEVGWRAGLEDEGGREGGVSRWDEGEERRDFCLRVFVFAMGGEGEGGEGMGREGGKGEGRRERGRNLAVMATHKPLV